MKKIHVRYKHGGDESMKYTLKELRARKNETQEETAKNLGISVQTYNAWEKDVSNVAVSKVYALAKYFGVSIDDIRFRRVG